MISFIRSYWTHFTCLTSCKIIGLSGVQGLEIVSDPKSPIVFLKLKNSTGFAKGDLQVLEDLANHVSGLNSLEPVCSPLSCDNIMVSQCICSYWSNMAFSLQLRKDRYWTNASCLLELGYMCLLVIQKLMWIKHVKHSSKLQPLYWQANDCIFLNDSVVGASRQRWSRLNAPTGITSDKLTLVYHC